MIGCDEIERTRCTCWWGKLHVGDGWEATDATGCRYIVSPVYPSDNAPDRKWGAAWIDGEHLGMSTRLHNTAQEAMNYVELYFASNQEPTA